MQIKKSILILALISWSFHSEAALSAPAGTIVITQADSGGNAAAYGLTYLNGPTNRTQVFACPRTSSGLIPDGRIQCSTFYGSSVSTEWQPGDILTASAAPQTSAEVPYNLRTTDNFLCQVTFTGWSGPCQGLGTLNTVRNLYECTFTLPASGTVEIGASFSGTDYKGDPCISISNPVPTATPEPSATPTSTPEDSPGNRLLDKITEAADEFADNLKLRDIIRGTAKFIIPKNPDFTYDVSVGVQAVSEGNSSALRLNVVTLKAKIKLEPILNSPVIASGRGKSSLSKVKSLRLASTKKGVKIAKGRKTLGVQIAVTTKSNSETIPQVIVNKVISR